MSGSESVNAFFPSIDRNLMRDLDRQLRGTPPEEPVQPDAVAELARVVEAQAPTRPDIAGVVEAVEQAASSLAVMADRIQALENRGDQLEAEIHRLTGELAAAEQAREGAESALRGERERGQRIEALAAHHVARSTTLEHDLDGTRADLAKVVDAITQALGAAV